MGSLLKNMRVVFYRFTLILLFFLVFIAFYFSIVTVPDKEKIFLNPGQSYIIYIISGSVLIGVLLFWGYRKITEMSNYIFTEGIIFGVIIVLQVLISRILINPITDCFTTIDQAIAMAEEQNGLLDNKMAYFERYTNNYFFTVLMYFYFKVIRIFGADYFYSAVVLNIICIDLSVFGCFNIVNILFGKKRALGALYLLAFCPTTYLFVSFPYTNTFSAPFIAGVLYFSLRIVNEKYEPKMLLINVSGFIFSAVVGTLIRPTTVIALIAAVIYMIMKKKSIKFFAGLFGMLAVMCIVFIGGNMVVKHHLMNKNNTGGFPATHWVMMGLNETGVITSEDVMFTKSFPTKSEKIEANVKVIKERLGDLGVGGLTTLYADKIGELWGVGTDDFQTHHSSAVRYTDSYEFIYGKNNGWLIMYCQMFRVLELLMALIFIVHMFRNKSVDKMYPVALTLLGIMVFLMLWETNRKHNICFIPILVIIMESGFNCCRYNAVGKCKKMAAIYGIIALFLAGDVLMIIDKPYFTDTPYTARDYSLYRIGNRLKKIDNVLENGKYVEQTFSTEKPFNVVAVHFKVNDVNNQESNYKLSLYKDGKCTESVVIGAGDTAEEGWYYMRCNEPKGSYTLKIEGNQGTADTMSPFVMHGIKMVPYRNTSMYVAGKEAGGSLSFNVYNEGQKTVVSEAVFWFIFGVLAVLQIIVVKICIIFRSSLTKKL